MANKVIGSAVILETRAVVKLACLVPQWLLWSNYYSEQVWRTCLTSNENATNGLPLMYCPMFSFCHSRWLKSRNLTLWTYMLWRNRTTSIVYCLPQSPELEWDLSPMMQCDANSKIVACGVMSALLTCCLHASTEALCGAGMWCLACVTPPWCPDVDHNVLMCLIKVMSLHSLMTHTHTHTHSSVGWYCDFSVTIITRQVITIIDIITIMYTLVA